VTDDESEHKDCDACKIRLTRRRVNRMRLTEMKEEADSTGKVMHI